VICVKLRSQTYQYINEKFTADWVFTLSLLGFGLLGLFLIPRTPHSTLLIATPQQGSVLIKKQHSSSWLYVQEPTPLEDGDQVMTGAYSSALISLQDLDIDFRLLPETKVVKYLPQELDSSILQFEYGALVMTRLSFQTNLSWVKAFIKSANLMIKPQVALSSPSHMEKV
jgi:hypothetical protein